VEVAGVGVLAFPLLDVQADQLKAVAEPAPYGLGEQTLIDVNVRRAWQIGPDRLHVGGTAWSADLHEITARAASGLGVSGRVSADLYKMLVYDEGCFFAGHRDTEKAPGMFATLVVVLPSTYTGGELLVRHQGQEERLDLRCTDPSEVAFAAFYADCLHELLPIASGHRLALVYNLTRKGRAPIPPDNRKEVAALTELVAAWHGPNKIVYLLEHGYTPAELSFDNLKGVDAARGHALRTAASRAGCDVGLAFFSVKESGYAEESWGDEEFEAVEVTDRSVTITDLRILDLRMPAADFPVEDHEIAPPGILENLAFDSESFHEATGNEGASFERTYRRTALVVWPERNRLSVINQAGPDASLPFLDSLVQAGSEDHARALASLMIDSWPRDVDAESPVAGLLESLGRLRADRLIERFLNEVPAQGNYRGEDAVPIVDSLSHLAPETAARALTAIIQGNAADRPAECAVLLAAAPSALAGPAAKLLVASLPTRVERLQWGLEEQLQAPLVRDVMSFTCAIDDALARRAVDRLLTNSSTYDMDSVLIPALIDLRRKIAVWTHPATQRLIDAALEHLRARIALPLEPPSDMTRNARLTCKCSDCAGLARFLAAPDQASWSVKAAEQRRRHLENTAKCSKADVDLSTDRRGSPYSLVFKKNRASYERRVAQRAEDLRHREALEA